MRRTCVVVLASLLCALGVAPAAVAAGRDTGSVPVITFSPRTMQARALTVQAQPMFRVAPYKRWNHGGGGGTGGGGGGGGPVYTNPAPQGYIPCDISGAYYLSNLPASGSGVTIAVVDAYAQPNMATDLAHFDATFGLPAPPSLAIYQQAGVRGNQGWGLEESMDVEWAHAVAPGANIALVEAASASLSDLLGAVNYAVTTLHANVVTMSWGAGEFSSESAYDSYFPTGSGTTFLASAGDSGTGTIWPSASPNVLSVGGTTLSPTATGDTTASHYSCSGSGTGANGSSETAWALSGGAQSAYEAFPAYQSGFDLFSTTVRGTPDVAWDGDPATGVAVFDSYGYNGQTGFFQVGGTSLGAPSWAGLVALADQQRAAAGKGALTIASGFGASPPYVAATAAAGSFTDITSGSNGPCSTCAAQPGFDLVTGLGTPVGSVLLSSSTTTGSLVGP